MGYLNKETITVDAILTKKGRQKLAEGRNAFNITKFAVADDEVDYGLYDPSHPLGTEYYGSAIENMPITEASADETQNLRYKLVSFPRSLNLNVIPTLRIDGFTVDTPITIVADGVVPISPETVRVVGAELDQNLGYTLVLYNGDAAQINVPSDGVVSERTSIFDANTLSGTAQVAVGRRFTIQASNVTTRTATQIMITGNESGATATYSLVIEPSPTS